MNFGITRIGLHAGPPLVGNFSGSRFFDYTAYGDAINTAARLEAANKFLGTRICVSATLAERTQNFQDGPLGDLILRGRSEPLRAYEPLPADAFKAPAMTQYSQAFAKLEAGGASAMPAFAALVGSRADYPWAGFHLKIVERRQGRPDAIGIEGAVDMTRDFPAGNYRFIPAVFQYSSGAAADPGYEIERVRFDKPVALAEGFAQVAKYIRAVGRPLTSFCACELRSPAAFTEVGFRNFNLHYVKALAEWGIYDGTTNPVARSNVAPEIEPPSEPSFYAFAFTRPSQTATSTFVIAGGAEAREGAGSYAERTVRYRDVSADGMKDKVRFTVSQMESRMQAFGFGWKDATGVQAYTVRDFYPVYAEELVRRGAARSGLTWHFARPPVNDLEFEMDCRRVAREMVI